MLKRHPNNSGSVSKESGNRAKPYRARLPEVIVFDVNTNRAKSVKKTIGYYKTESEGWRAIAKYMRLHPTEFAQSTKGKINFDATLEEIWNRYIHSTDYLEISKSTKANYQAVWNKYLYKLHDLPIAEIKTSQLEDLIDNIQAKSGTKKNTLIVMRKLFDIAIADDVVEKNYAEYVKISSDEVEIERKVFTSDEIRTIWSNQRIWLAQILLVMLYTGMRITEVISLKKEDVDLDAMIIHIPKGKNKFAVRDVPIHSALQSLFISLMDKSSNYLIECENEPISDKRCQHSQDLMLEICGSAHFVYDAKHTFVTQAEIVGMKQLAKINIIGHTPKITSDKYYTHLPIEELREEIEKIKY